jgi:hypothetical protein
MVGRAAEWRGDRTREAELVQVKLVDKGVNKPNRIVIGDILVERGRKEQRRIARRTVEMGHEQIFLVNIIMDLAHAPIFIRRVPRAARFSHSLGFLMNPRFSWW